MNLRKLADINFLAPGKMRISHSYYGELKQKDDEVLNFPDRNGFEFEHLFWELKCS